MTRQGAKTPTVLRTEELSRSFAREGGDLLFGRTGVQPREHSMALAMIHRAAADGYKIAGDVYERGRPSYPPEAIACLIHELGLGIGKTVADVGAGTGKLTRLLVPNGSELFAVEPVAGMRHKLTEILPDVGVREGTAEAMPFADGSLGAVVVGQAFHWFDGDKALSEFSRVLKPEGRLGLIWNVRDESVPWVAALTALTDVYQGDAPRYKSGAWREAFARTELFTPLQSKQFPYAQEGSPEMIVDRTISVSFIAALPEEQRQKVVEDVRHLLKTHPMTQNQTTLALLYRTNVFWCSKRNQ